MGYWRMQLEVESRTKIEREFSTFQCTKYSECPVDRKPREMATDENAPVAPEKPEGLGVLDPIRSALSQTNLIDLEVVRRSTLADANFRRTASIANGLRSHCDLRIGVHT